MLPSAIPVFIALLVFALEASDRGSRNALLNFAEQDALQNFLAVGDFIGVEQ